jgi:hypothetical protein
MERSMSIETLLDQMEGAHHQHYSDGDAQLRPFIMLINDQDQLHTYTEVPMGEDRSATVLAILDAVVATRSPGYIFSSEAWLSVVDKKDFPTMPRPRDDPQKQEVLIMEGNTFTETSMRVYDIVRDDAGKVTELRRKTDTGKNIHSRYDIFPRPKHDLEDFLNKA